MNDDKYIPLGKERVELPVREGIVQHAMTLEESIRDYARSQKEGWQQIPLLALEADGRTGFSEKYSRAYKSGYWALESSIRDGRYQVYIDLETGELVDASSVDSSFPILDLDIPKEGNPQPAKPECVLQIAHCMQELHAPFLIEKLKLKGGEPVQVHTEKNENWREVLKEQLGLSEVYTR